MAVLDDLYNNTQRFLCYSNWRRNSNNWTNLGYTFIAAVTMTWRGELFVKVTVFKLITRILCLLLKSNVRWIFKNGQTWSLSWTNLIQPTPSHPNFVNCNINIGPGSSVGTATGYGLDGPGSNPAWGRDFLPVQTGPGTHPASCKMGTGSFPGLKCGRGVLLTTQPLLVPRSWKSRAIPLPTLWDTPGL